MDWLTLLLAFVFFVLPVLQEVIGRRNRRPAENDDLSTGEVTTPEVRPDDLDEQGGGSWSSDWGGWPTGKSEPEPEDGRAKSGSGSTVEAKPSRPVSSEPAPLAVPSWDDDVAVYTSPAAQGREVDSAAVELRPSVRPRRRFVAPAAQVEISAPSHSRRQLALEDIESLRRAIVLAEVIGPPVSVRSLADRA